MAGQILLPLRRSDRIELFLPYVEQMTNRETRVVFLVQVGLRGAKELTGQLLDIHTGIRSAYPPVRNCDEDAMENRTRSAEQKINIACQSLRERGVKLEVHGYGGPLPRIVRQY